MSVDVINLRVTKLTASVGAAISGVSLKRINDDTRALIHSAFLDHCVLVFRDQFLTPTEQLAFAQCMGEVMTYEGLESAKHLPPGVMQLSNDGKMPTITENWHSDGPYLPVPAAIGILAPLKLPVAGGDTMWANQYLAYERLSDGLKRLLAGLQCQCESNRLTKNYDLENLFSAIQPIVRKHPETGRLSLYVGSSDTFINFVGLTRAESQPVLRYLYDRACQPDLVYRHTWRPGDVVMWDNRCTLHYAVHDYATEPREMYRIAIKGTLAISGANLEASRSE